MAPSPFIPRVRHELALGSEVPGYARAALEAVWPQVADRLAGAPDAGIFVLDAGVRVLGANPRTTVRAVGVLLERAAFLGEVVNARLGEEALADVARPGSGRWVLVVTARHRTLFALRATCAPVGAA